MKKSRAGAKRSGTRTASTRPGRYGRSLATAVTPAVRRALGKQPTGLGAFVCIVDGVDSSGKLICTGKGRITASAARRRLAEHAHQSWVREAVRNPGWAKLAAVCSAAGAAPRIRMLAKLLEGQGGYQSLKRLTGLQPGPLYHHLDRLRLAGLVRVTGRDRYMLTPKGRSLILLLAAASNLF